MNLWKRVTKQQAKYYNAKHQPKIFKKGEKVLLRDINIRILRFKKKIDHKQLKSFEILKRIDTQTYKLKLSAIYERVHFVFHVSLLKSWHSRDENFESQTILIDDEKKWKLNEILDKRIRKSESEYLIK